MNKLVFISSPFTLNQNVLVFKDNEQIETITFKAEETIDKIKETIAKYQINDIDLVGNKTYLELIAGKLMNEYSALQIHFIER